MTFEELLDQAIAMLQRRGRVTYGALKRQFNLDDAYLADLKAEIIKGQRLATDEDGEVLVWMGEAASPPTTAATPAPAQERPPLAYTSSTTLRASCVPRGGLVYFPFAKVICPVPSPCLNGPLVSARTRTSWPISRVRLRPWVRCICCPGASPTPCDYSRGRWNRALLWKQ